MYDIKLLYGVPTNYQYVKMLYDYYGVKPLCIQTMYTSYTGILTHYNTFTRKY